MNDNYDDRGNNEDDVVCSKYYTRNVYKYQCFILIKCDDYIKSKYYFHKICFLCFNRPSML